MITIKTGKLFCEKYNEVNGTNYTPKEIFVNIIAPIWFKDKKHLHSISNSKFHYTFKKDYSYDKALEEFCSDIENENKNFGLMTSLRVLGGCAAIDCEELKTTYAMANDGMYFTIDERYCSFIGVLFTINLGDGFLVPIYDKNFIWLLYESVLAYRKYLNENDDEKEKGNNVTIWNAHYVFNKCVYGNLNLNDVYCDTKNKKKLTIAKFIVVLSKLDKMPKYIELERYNKSNTTCGAILLDKTPILSLKSFYDYLGIGTNKDFELNLFECDSSKFLESFMKNGEIGKSAYFDIVYDITKNKSNKDHRPHIISKLKALMKKEDLDIVKELSQIVKDCKDSNQSRRLGTPLEKMFASSNWQQFTKTLDVLCDTARYDIKNFKDVLYHMANDGVDDDKDRLRNILFMTRLDVC